MLIGSFKLHKCNLAMTSEYYKKWVANNREKVREYQREYQREYYLKKRLTTKTEEKTDEERKLMLQQYRKSIINKIKKN